jgi:hypothetical protein
MCSHEPPQDRNIARIVVEQKKINMKKIINRIVNGDDLYPSNLGWVIILTIFIMCLIIL